MHFLRCLRAEWSLVRPRLTRTSYGISLLLLGAALLWLRARGLDPLAVSLEAGALGAIVGVALTAGSQADRAAFATTLTHPTTPLAAVAGRWIAAVAPAALLAAACTLATGSAAGTAIAGALAAAAVGGCTLAGALAFGNVAAAGLFLFMAVAGAMPPEELVALAHPGALRLAAAGALELGPALWHYRDAATGAIGPILHALAWAGLGVLLAGKVLAHSRQFR